MINEVVLFLLGARGTWPGEGGGGVCFFLRALGVIAGQRYALTCDCNNENMI